MKELIVEAKNGDKLFWDRQNWYSVQKYCPMIAKLDAWSKARRRREIGVYWLRRSASEIKITAWWGGDAWLVPGWHGWHRDSALIDIDERRILPPE